MRLNQDDDNSEAPDSSVQPLEVEIAAGAELMEVETPKSGVGNIDPNHEKVSQSLGYTTKI